MLTGKTIAITGAASGIGAATARRVKEAGGKVIALDRAAAEGYDRFIQVDLSVKESIDAAVSQIDEDIDGLCNIAGVSMASPPPHVVTVNFLAPRYLTERLIPRLRSGASVIAMASVGGRDWRDNLEEVRACLALSSFAEAERFCTDHKIAPHLSYKLTKEALIVWMLQAAADTPRNIRFNCVSPGMVETPLLRESLEAGKERSKAMLARVSGIDDPRDVAKTVVFLLSDDSGLINGADLPVDRGLAAKFNIERYGLN